MPLSAAFASLFFSRVSSMFFLSLPPASAFASAGAVGVLDALVAWPPAGLGYSSFAGCPLSAFLFLAFCRVSLRCSLARSLVSFTK
eukprot:8372801-Pyramimonas_sp.AAC.1